MRTSIATVSLSGDLRSKVSAISRAGFDGLELFENDLLTFDGHARAVRRFVEDSGLSIVAFQPFRDFEGMPEPQRSRVFDRAERKFDLMGELGTDLLLVCSNVSPLSLGGLDRAADDLSELGERAWRHGIRIGFEALAWGRHISDYRDAWEVVRRANHPAIGTILDTFHILARGLEVKSLASIPREKIFLVQVADAPSLEMGVLSWSRHFRNFPGQGNLPLKAFMQGLEATGYEGFLSLEIFNDQFRAAPPASTALDGFRSLVYLQELMPASKASGHIETHGIGFIEFAVSEEVATRMAALFARLGFEQVGQHRSKSVSLWRQGRVKLILNAETEGFAHSYNLVHGSSVCAIALEVDDTARALDRASTYHCQVFRQPVQPGEHEIPAIGGVDGSLIYLLERQRVDDAFWAVDFELKSPVGIGVGLEQVDHIGQVMPSTQGLSWLLFYRSVFGLDASNLLDIPDPSGLIQSQVVENRARTLRLVLNASQNSGTLASRFLSDYYGGGVQHIAFSSADIFASVAAWCANGIQLLPVPQNYYDDLEARFGLERTLLERLQHLNILYDQTPEGEFFHAYTQTFEDLFFFEVCERRNYDQYGAINAPIRIAAQTRLIQQANSGGGDS